MADPVPAIRCAAPAKINLYLHVVGRRDDGYHLLDSLVGFAGIEDTIEVVPAERLTLEVGGPFGRTVPSGGANLVLKAARALAEAAGIRTGARISLTKRLPPSSGMGGGSADAAATLRALSALWGVDMADDEALALALRLGADVPVCLRGRAVYMGGIGERLTLTPDLPPAWFVLVNPGVPVSTPAVFKARRGDFSPPAPPLELPPVGLAGFAAALKARRNDLEPAARELVPVVGTVLDELAGQEGVLVARMSGSGGTCFGLFGDPGSAGQAAARITAARAGWWVAVAPLLGDTSVLED